VEPTLSHLQITVDRQRIVQGLSALLRVLVENLPSGSKIHIHGEKNKRGLNLIMTIPPAPLVTSNAAPSARERLAISLTRLVAEQHG
ncbi:hypothetical protein ACI39O_26925, partial [Klebsiella pneumoniae]|uniref:hypothetical protein n=1 Tax=Klebsiella pneumoniae TaxID=573 RepID=UPI0038527540